MPPDKNYNLYFDNAATSWPKPEPVYTAAEKYLRSTGGSPGRSSHSRALRADRLVYEARERVSSFLGAENPGQIVFTLNATDALNMAIKGLLQQGDHVILTTMEHNSVLRPLGSLKRKGIINTTVVPASTDGYPDLDYLQNSLTSTTRLVICSHASNVLGTIMPVKSMAEIAHRHNCLLLVDAAQSAGCLHFNVKELGVDLLAFTGHKGLLGPPGSGGLYVREGIKVDPWREGGTGSQSEKDEHPSEMPERLEAGTMNVPGIAGLNEGIKFLQSEGMEQIRAHELSLATRLLDGLNKIPGITIYGPSRPEDRLANVSFNLKNFDAGELAFALEENFGIQSRTGLHCAPLAHKSAGTFPHGTIRLSPGYFHREEEVDYVLECLEQTARHLVN